MFAATFSLGIDDGDEAISSYIREEEEENDDVQYQELDESRLAFDVTEIDVSGITMASNDRFTKSDRSQMNGEASCKLNAKLFE